jgi:hypothetical protein
MSTVSHSSETASQVSDRLVHPKKRGMIAVIVSALHASRRRQACRVLRQYAFLRTSDLQQNSADRE